MSVLPNAPYQDQIKEDCSVLIYEGHDKPKTANIRNPKSVDQREFLPSGNPTENGKFHRAAQDYKRGSKSPDTKAVHVQLPRNPLLNLE